jgi:ornithine cyclodeaminase
VFALADLVVVDSREQCAQIGELHHALDAEIVLSPDDATELGEICAGSKPGRTSAEQTIVCDLTGVGVQDVAAANVVMERAGDAGETIET